jgi:hypothetical protein
MVKFRFYEAENCVGMEYHENPGNNTFIKISVVSDGVLYYANAPNQIRTMRSVFNPSDNACLNFSDNGQPNGYQLDSVTLCSFPLSDLGLTPPFKLAR